ncbi:hypothetical protein ANN_10262 [Periplaneta americana]|uniref:Uncharacterized protein n=1 Tax=Periplaneta americana TaxID=6978 RepID=A0ABQ8TQY2_PERAM|nr:hypothetical protein ANN_10262 [Periplaneta americana]
MLSVTAAATTTTTTTTTATAAASAAATATTITTSVRRSFLADVRIMSVLSKKLKVGIYKTVILPIDLYGCETWNLTLREEHRLRVFENKVFRKIFGAKRNKATGEWRKLHNAELHALYSSPDIPQLGTLNPDKSRNWPYFETRKMDNETLAETTMESTGQTSSTTIKYTSTTPSWEPHPPHEPHEPPVDSIGLAEKMGIVAASIFILFIVIRMLVYAITHRKSRRGNSQLAQRFSENAFVINATRSSSTLPRYPVDDPPGEMSPGSNTESYAAFTRIGLRENPGKNLNQITCPDRESNPGHLVSRPDVLTVTPQVWTS